MKKTILVTTGWIVPILIVWFLIDAEYSKDCYKPKPRNCIVLQKIEEETRNGSEYYFITSINEKTIDVHVTRSFYHTANVGDKITVTSDDSHIEDNSVGTSEHLPTTYKIVFILTYSFIYFVSFLFYEIEKEMNNRRY